jgi:outer membrane lipoprotein SlyB
MRTLFHPLVAAVLSASLMACATTSTESTMWTVPEGTVREGQVVGIQQVVQRTQGDPVGGALLGAVIGGLVLRNRHGGPSLFGAAAGAGIGAAASSGSETHVDYRVIVQFADGYQQSFIYHDGVPFRPGDYVVQTSQGLEPR